MLNVLKCAVMSWEMVILMGVYDEGNLIVTEKLKFHDSL
jgi:hypothetical protein